MCQEVPALRVRQEISTKLETNLLMETLPAIHHLLYAMPVQYLLI